MKKTFTLILMVLCAGMAQAQLKVDTAGAVRMGTGITIDKLYSAEITAAAKVLNALHIVNMGRTSQSTDSQSGIFIEAYGVNSPVMVGVQSTLKQTGQSQVGTRIGVYGLGKGGESGRNYGVIGTVNDYGAGIYGTTNTSITNPITLDAKYAGYFKGQTKVQGHLDVTGGITGTLISPDASTGGNYSGISQYEMIRESADLSGKLQAINAATFYYDNSTSQKTKSSKNAYIDKGKELSDLEDEDVSFLEEQLRSKRHYSLSAEQLEEVFPDLVYDNEDGTKSINYVEMVPILVQAINELSAKLEVLEGKDGTIKKVKTQATSVEEIGGSVTLLSLGQNKPNPFGTSTSIEVCIPEDVQSAFIYVYDLTGKKLQQVDIAARGKQNVTLNAASLTDGMYLYSLIADGKVVETRRMIVEK